MMEQRSHTSITVHFTPRRISRIVQTYRRITPAGLLRMLFGLGLLAPATTRTLDLTAGTGAVCGLVIGLLFTIAERLREPRNEPFWIDSSRPFTWNSHADRVPWYAAREAQAQEAWWAVKRMEIVL